MVRLQVAIELLVSCTRLISCAKQLPLSAFERSVSSSSDSESSPIAVTASITAVFHSKSFALDVPAQCTIAVLRERLLRACGCEGVCPNELSLSIAPTVHAAKQQADKDNMDCFPDNDSVITSEGIVSGCVLKVTCPSTSVSGNATIFTSAAYPFVFSDSTPFK